MSQQCLIAYVPLYMRACPNNLLQLKPHPVFSTILIFLILGQLGVLYLQRLWGPKFLVPHRFRPVQYQYIHTFLDTNDLESNNLTERAPESMDECVICMHSLRMQVNDMMQPVGEQRFTNTYMRTPCNHNFHQKCLQNWMRIKLECPVCREPLPAVDIVD